MLARLIAATQHSAEIVLGPCTAAQTVELSATMRSADWRDLADGYGIRGLRPEHVTAALAHLRLAAQIEEHLREMQPQPA